MKYPALKILPALLILNVFSGCNSKKNINADNFKKEIFNTEKEFEAAAANRGIAEAFYYYADSNAVIHRQNDTLIIGKENIKNFYQKEKLKNAVVNWTPDFVDVSADGKLGYTYGRYIWKIKDENGKTSEFTGVFHTVWKRQEDGTWKYVWD